MFESPGQDSELVAQQQVLSHAGLARASPGQDGREQEPEQFKHAHSIADSCRARFCRLTTSHSVQSCVVCSRKFRHQRRHRRGSGGDRADLSVGLALLAIAWVLRDPVVAVALAGTRRPQEIEENVRALEVVLSPQTLERIDRCLSHAAGQTDTFPIPDWA